MYIIQHILQIKIFPNLMKMEIIITTPKYGYKKTYMTNIKTINLIAPVQWLINVLKQTKKTLTRQTKKANQWVVFE